MSLSMRGVITRASSALESTDGSVVYRPYGRLSTRFQVLLRFLVLRDRVTANASQSLKRTRRIGPSNPSGNSPLPSGFTNDCAEVCAERLHDTSTPFRGPHRPRSGQSFLGKALPKACCSAAMKPPSSLCAD